jgi:hypothetical protein
LLVPPFPAFIARVEGGAENDFNELFSLFRNETFAQLPEVAPFEVRLT